VSVEVASGGRRLRVRPPSEPAGGDQDVLEVVIEPAGLHPTTRLCLELLLELEPDGGLCESGAGSAVVAIVAARLGYAPVVAVAPGDPELVRRNAAANGVAVRVVGEPTPWAPTVVTNEPLTLERPPERLILAGYAGDHLAFAGLAEVERRVQGEWAAIRLEPA
jgi:ribosomal protein L11 methyltransferase